MAEDPAFKLKYILRGRNRAALRSRGLRKPLHTEESLGCSVAEFLQYIQGLFSGNMTWENYGEVWELGHRRPLASFDLTDLAQWRECAHYTNLFPQLVSENRSQGARYAGVDFTKFKACDYVVRQVSLGEAVGLVEEYHYSRAAPSAATICYGLFHREAPAELIGAAIFRPAPLGAALKECSDPQSVLCLSRLVLIPDMPTNTASYFVAQCLRFLRSQQKWKCVLSYADTWKEHSGVVYKASNWEYLGLTAPQPVWTLEGRFIGKRRGKQKAYTGGELRELGAVFHGRFSKHIFRFRL